jgi:tripartite-type tricarboxylate transporter receptor subunit TctC
MKKLLAVIFLLCTSTFVSAENINAIWSFNIANTQGTYFRLIMEESNKLQSKYQFIADSKPGAGGQISATYVADQKQLTLLGTTYAFFIRPNLYQVPYKYDQFQIVHVMTVAPPALVTKNKTLKEILAKEKISIGTAGPGTGTHLNAIKFKESLPDKDIVVVPYKSSTDAVKDVMGGHIDLTFEYLGDAEAYGARILGVAGTAPVKNYALLKDIGFSNQTDMVNSYFILANSSATAEQVQELRKLFTRAEKNKSVQELYAKDHSTKPGLHTQEDYVVWYNKNIRFWRDATKGQRVE